MLKRKMTQKALHNWGNIFLNGYFLTVLPRAVFRTQSKVYGGAFFTKKPHHKCLTVFQKGLCCL